MRHTLNRRGMALIAVLWLVAAMSLILTGVVRSVRTEAHTAGLQRQVTLASATADAAILLALQSLHAGQKETPKGRQTVEVTFAGAIHSVSVSPLNGLLDLNAAPVPVLADLYQYAAGLDPQSAQLLAQATVETRQIKSTGGSEQGFDAVQDLMRVPGMSYGLYAKVAPLVTADLKMGGGRVNPLAAPYELLLVLTAGNAARAAQFVSQREADPNTLDTTFLKPALIEMTTSKSLKFQASIGLPDGATLQKDWLVYWDADVSSDLPWRVLATHQAVLN